MAITLKRQLNDTEKAQIIKQHGRVDWATGRTIPEEETIHFDHIQPYARGGYTELNNIAPMSQQTNLKKGQLTLAEFKTKLLVDGFFETGDRLTLGHLLKHLKTKGDVAKFGEPMTVQESEGEIRLRTDALKEFKFDLQTCPITGWRYFYATLPIEMLDSDDDTDPNQSLQPRYLIPDKVFGLYRHFISHPVLQPCIGRIVGQKIRIFDGQHKVAGLLFGGRRDFECKIYLDPDIRLLNQTNISAHDNYAQTRFFSSVMVTKLGALFGRDFEEYKADESIATKSEAGFMTWLQAKDPEATWGNLKKRFRSFLYTSVLQDPGNELSPLVSASNRSNERTPLTMDQLEKSLLSDFMYREPLGDSMTSDAYRRELEFENVVFLMNELYARALHLWNPQAGKSDHQQMALNRLVGSKSMQAWSEILRDAVRASLRLIEQQEWERVFHRPLDPAQRDAIGWTVQRLVEWKGWYAPPGSDIDRHLSDNVSELQRWFKDQGLSAGYLMGAPE